MKRLTLYFILGALLLQLCLLVSTDTVLAKKNDALFEQQILPLNCVYQIVDDGLGTIIYLTPQECGHVVHPPKKPTTKPTKGGGKSTKIQNKDKPVHVQRQNYSPPGLPVLRQPHSANTDHGTKSIILNDSPDALARSGYRKTVMAGDIFTYIPLTGKKTTKHTIRITSVLAAGVSILIQPSNQLIFVPNGSTKYLDYDADHKPSLAITVTRSADGKALLDIRLLSLDQPLVIPSEESTPHTLGTATVVVILALALVTARWYLPRLPQR